MTVVADYLSHRPYNYWSDPVRTSFDCCYKYALFCAHRERQSKRQWNTTAPSMNIGVPMTCYFATLYRKLTTQIPIARLPSLTAWLRPAVSSLEARKTPAR
jgi:hypothetical protein